jgi:fructose-1,6-bisphosphatase I
MATDGKMRILDIEPQQLHQRVPLFIGSKNDVQNVMEIYNSAA